MANDDVDWKDIVCCVIPIMIYEVCLSALMMITGVFRKKSEGLLSSVSEHVLNALVLFTTIGLPILWIIAYSKLKRHCTCQASQEQDIELTLSPVLRQG